MLVNEIDEVCDEPEYLSEYDLQRAFAAATLEIYFEDKKWHVGGRIPKSEAGCSENVDMVMYTKHNEQTYDFLHQRCLAVIERPRIHFDYEGPWRQGYLLHLMRKMHTSRVLQDFIPGLLLLHFKLVHGIDISEMEALVGNA